MSKFGDSLSELEERIKRKGVENVDVSEEVSDYLSEKDNAFLVQVCESVEIPNKHSTRLFDNTETIDSILAQILSPYYNDAIRERLKYN